MKLIKNAHIVTMEGSDFEHGYLLIDGDKIAAVGDMNDAPASADEIIDADGLYLLPGFVDAHCHVGMWEESIGEAGADGNEETAPITPQLRAIDAINPFDEAFENARKAGVTTVVTGPGSANVLGGQFAALKTDGICVDEMIIKAPVAQKAALGENPKASYGAKNQAPMTRMASVALLRETLLKAKEYARKWDTYNQNPKKEERPELDFQLESLLPVIRKEIPLKVHAHRADDICTAIRIGEEFEIRVTLEHCTEGHLIADILKDKNLPITLGPTLGSKSKPELSNLSYSVYTELEKRGVDFAIMTDHGEIPIQELYLCAMLAVRAGITKETALRAITVHAAKNAGIDDRVGSIRAGKDADILLMRGEPMTFDARIEKVFIGGKQIL